LQNTTVLVVSIKRKRGDTLTEQKMTFKSVAGGEFRASLAATFGISPDGLALKSVTFKIRKDDTKAMVWLNSFLENYARHWDYQKPAEMLKNETTKQTQLICRAEANDCIFEIPNPYGMIVWDALVKFGFVRSGKQEPNYKITLAPGDSGFGKDPRKEFTIVLGDPAKNGPKKGISEGQKKLFDSLIMVPGTITNKP